MNNRFKGTGLALALATLLAGCGSTVKLDETPVETRTPTPAAATTAQSAASTPAGSATRPQSQVATVDLNRSAAAGGGASGSRSTAELARVVYFDFDSFVIKDDFRGLVDAHAKALTADKNRHMVIEGHTDERGGREYNLALGQKRAEAVQKSMQLLGVADSQLEAVSYGKERPVAEGHDEAAWAKNRRAELKDR